MTRSERRVIKAAMRQHALLSMNPVPSGEWMKAEEELGKACAAHQSALKRSKRK